MATKQAKVLSEPTYCEVPGCQSEASVVQDRRALCNEHAKPLPEIVLKKNPEKTLAQLREELFLGQNELFNEFFASIAEQSELTPEQVERVTEYLQGAVQKRDNLANFIKAVEEEAERLRGREKAIAERRQEFERIASMFRFSILTCMTNNPLGIVKRVDGAESSFRVHQNPSRILITDEAAIPGEFINYRPEVDKRAIADALAEGKEVPGAKLDDPRFHLVIK